MNIHQFIENLDDVLNGLEKSKEPFVTNMIKENQKEDRLFSEWLNMFLAWNEILYEEDIQRYYWYLDEE